MGIWPAIRSAVIGPYILLVIYIALAVFVYWYNWGHQKHFQERAHMLLRQYAPDPRDIQEITVNLNLYREDEKINGLIKQLTDKRSKQVIAASSTPQYIDEVS